MSAHEQAGGSQAPDARAARSASRRYVRITVHEDVLTDAIDLVNRLHDQVEIGLPVIAFDIEDVRTLQHVLDPLPEPDVNGITPGIEEVTL